MIRIVFFTLVSLFSLSIHAQPDRWQQRVKYTMNIDMNVQTNQYKGKQKIDYWNNSPDTLNRVFFHLYWNAFQPNSMMDVRSRRQGTIVTRKDREGRDVHDWDARVRDRIMHLKPDEIGYQRVSSIQLNGRNQKTILHETILEVVLDKPILPKSKVVFDMDWDAQVPLQIRRSGRDNPNSKVRYTMTQWYPKIAEYDNDGWHPNPYIAREFYGVWGDFDVTINIDKKYVIGGTGYLQNAQQVGHGYENKALKLTRPAGNTLTWKFNAPNVHDFAWAADPDFVHLSKKIRNDVTIHVLYDKEDKRVKDWEAIIPKIEKIFPFVEKNFGDYPYKQYSFIHGGDGGMEYPMATMLSGPGDGVVVHEFMHSWYQGLLGTNESLYAWMDEGFTTYAENLAIAYLNNSTDWPQGDDYANYFALVRSGLEEPLTTHADHFNTNFAYSVASYSKGAVFLEQLGYIVGAGNLQKILLEYYRQWRFRHPNANDFVRVAEKVSGITLDWYKEHWVHSTKTINYAIDSLWEAGTTNIRLRNIGTIPMPVDVKITFKDGSSEWHYIPQYLMFGTKPAEKGQEQRKVYESWKWTHPTYQISTTRKLTDISTVEIDPSQRMADYDWKNNKIELKW
ncbi:MAG TPA: M1 family metallopeptidase [Flavisolibacter sp.]|nr:M1 family metallopeptidase [Flavisolibacter sp.]